MLLHRLCVFRLSVSHWLPSVTASSAFDITRLRHGSIRQHSDCWPADAGPQSVSSLLAVCLPGSRFERPAQLPVASSSPPKLMTPTATMIWASVIAVLLSLRASALRRLPGELKTNLIIQLPADVIWWLVRYSFLDSDQSGTKTVCWRVCTTLSEPRAARVELTEPGACVVIGQHSNVITHLW